MKAELLTLATELQECSEANAFCKSELERLTALAAEHERKLPGMVADADPLKPKTLAPIAESRLILEFVPARKARLERDLARERNELVAAIRLAHAVVLREIERKECELRAVILTSCQRLCSDPGSAESLASSAYFKNALGDQLRNLRNSLAPNQPDPVRGAQSVLSVAEVVETITVPETL